MSNPAAAKVGFDVQALFPLTSQNVTTSGSSAQSSALDAETRVIRLHATTDTYVAIGANPTATTSSLYLPAFSVEYFTVPKGSFKVAGLQVSAAGSLNIVEMR